MIKAFFRNWREIFTHLLYLVSPLHMIWEDRYQAWVKTTSGSGTFKDPLLIFSPVGSPRQFLRNIRRFHKLNHKVGSLYFVTGGTKYAYTRFNKDESLIIEHIYHGNPFVLLSAIENMVKTTQKKKIFS